MLRGDHGRLHTPLAQDLGGSRPDDTYAYVLEVTGLPTGATDCIQETLGTVGAGQDDPVEALYLARRIFERSRVRRLDDLAALGAFERPLPLLAARDQRLLELSLPAAQVHGPVVLCVDPQAPAEALVRRAGWLANGA